MAAVSTLGYARLVVDPPLIGLRQDHGRVVLFACLVALAGPAAVRDGSMADGFGAPLTRSLR